MMKENDFFAKPCFPHPQLRERRTDHVLPSGHCPADRRQPAERMDTHRPQTGATLARHRHEPLLPTLRTRTGETHD